MIIKSYFEKKFLADTIRQINTLEPELEKLTDFQIKEKICELIQKVSKNENSDAVLIESFAITREASKRTIGLRHFDTQLMGGVILNNGKIAEMKTGEGKTLVATLPTSLNALSLKGAHVVTTNDYLAKRDQQWMGQIYRFLGFSVGLIQQKMSLIDRKKSYSSDITYVTNREVAFDYLRDNLSISSDEVVQRPYNYCLIRIL